VKQKLVAEKIGKGFENQYGLVGDFGADSVAGQDG
jgi:hypothetical protein